ncbi:hypothetical protein F2Q70_00026339 [Brassica cretica]|uniref:Uncharacterized protein n=1 Tax=Brassica cretica TaxID=69181 RepID=A0A8S9L455_BRACR|nr:hypothetical protein F2Q68_00025898 [Brassica cretica]KAF2602064.1 hypothetical protein F2Q70_00026339 [Brassica cretica]
MTVTTAEQHTPHILVSETNSCSHTRRRFEDSDGSRFSWGVVTWEELSAADGGEVPPASCAGVYGSEFVSKFQLDPPHNPDPMVS